MPLDATYQSVTEYNILGKISVERFHQNDIKCSKVFVDDKWTGQCPLCVQYASLWKDNRRDEARQLKPVEKHVFACSGSEPLVCTRSLASIIGNGTGKFLVVKKLIHTGFEENNTERVFPCYDDSHFVVKY